MTGTLRRRDVWVLSLRYRLGRDPLPVKRGRRVCGGRVTAERAEVELRVLGSIEIDCGGRRLALGSGQQRRLLTALIVQAGQVVSVDRLVEVLWGDRPPPSAVKALHTHVSRLRASLAGCGGGDLVRTRAPGYVLAIEHGQLDADRFERLVGAVGGEDDRVRRVALLDEALGLWRGPALAEFAAESFARAEAARLEGLRQVAIEARADARLDLGQHAEVAVELEAVCGDQPLRETPHAQRMVALYRSGRHADALAVYQAFRVRLADELGLDPSPDLQDLERRVLQHDPDLAQRPGTGQETPRTTARPRGDPGRAPAPTGEAAVGDEIFVGREAELAALIGAARAAEAKSSQVVLVTGEAGVGKSSLLARFAPVLESEGWLISVGRCPEHEGAPPAWPWVEVLGWLAERVPPGELAEPLAPLLTSDQTLHPELDASAGRFRLRRAVCAWLRAAAESSPLAVVLDDLHAADAETLGLLVSVADELGEVPILIVAAFRPADVGDRLREALGLLARGSPHRVALTGLAPTDVDRLVRALHEAPVDAATVDALAERTGGNPFYVRESVRLLASEGALVARSEVPDGVRDVLRRRLGRLPPAAVSVLGVAAVVGLEADVDVVAMATDTDESGVLAALEGGLVAGLLTEPAPGLVRFVHALVRDTVYTDISQTRRARIHARVAAALSHLRPDDHPALAHHFARAASSDTAVLAVDHAVRAAELAEGRYAHHVAVALLIQALECHQRAPTGPGDRSAERIDLLGRLLRAQVRAGALADARATRQHALDLAVQAGRQELLIEAFTAWTEPTPWTVRPYATVDGRAVAALTGLLDRGDLDPRTRCRLLTALTAELAGEGDQRAARAATDAVALAEGLDDPALLAHALYELAREVSWDREPDRRARLAHEITQLGTAHDLVAYRWLGEYISATVAGARGDPTALRHHVERGLQMAEAYQMAEPLGSGLCSRAMLAHIAGGFEDAERGYAEACAHLERHGSPHGTGAKTLAMVTIRVSQRRIAEFAPFAAVLQDEYGPLAIDVAALALATAGDHDHARGVLADPPTLRPDFYFSIFATLRAMAAVMVGHHELADEVYAALLPIHDQLAGAASTSHAMRPIAHTLGELAHLLGRTTVAVEHLTEAVAVAETWQAPIWEADARRALAALPPHPL